MDDPFGNMREQMERERDNFFKTVNPRDWPSDSSMRGGMFNRPRTSFGGFPSGPADLPGHHNSLPRTRREPGVEGGSEQSDQSDPDLSIPIRVIHEKPRPRYGQAQHSNTTELPAKAAAGNESPRLERAHSEPPGKFKQRLNISNPSAYTTIPEYGEGETGRAQTRSRPSTFNVSLEPSNPIKTSASAPSVPGSSHGSSHNFQESQPAPPPRRSPPRAGAMAGQGAPGGNIRHIPIFVEGRSDPIFNQNQPGELPFSKPSDYYPPGVVRVNSQQEGGLGQEPTTPLGPPPGPIPMGYTPHQQSLQPTAVPAEPTTPLGPPLGPIPMGYISQPEDSLKPQQNPQEPTTPQGPPPGPIPMGFLPSQEGEAGPADPKVSPPVPPQRNRSQTQQTPVSCEEQPTAASKQDVARKPSAELAAAAENTKRKDSESSDNRKDPQVNVIPIKIDQSRPESPRPPNQEPGLKPNMNPAPAPATKTEAPPPAANPKIAKLDKIKDDVETLMEKIQKFDGSKTDKEYLYLDEMLTRHLISLDGIDPEGQLEIRQLRKESIKSVNRCLSLLDRKVSEVTGAEADHNNQVLSELAEKSDNKTS